MIHQSLGQGIIDTQQGDTGTHQNDAGQVVLGLLCIHGSWRFPCVMVGYRNHHLFSEL
ncbi:hypothetical protein SMB34_07725 [Thalassospira permensis NBRC 106175]|uniref:Uncharacterized protein n=1 Tax=Thalassospira permensis NBRC 106175 TaxID=1353532 RepID=A0ABR4TJY7_9PROT|nr:hypothetical protein SMB34_07725 [Thalassospira permensis NBRC 106175]